MPKPDVATDPRFVNKRFKKGQSGNPAGRKKGSASLKQKVLKLLEKELGDADGNDRMDVLAAHIVREAVQNGNHKMIELLLDRLWPKTEKREVTNVEGAELPTLEERKAEILEIFPTRSKDDDAEQG